MSDAILRQLVEMSRYLGAPHRTYAILGEGNTSAKVDANTFYVKASGFTLADADEGAFVRVAISTVTELLDNPSAGDEEVTATFQRALVEPGEKRRPSTEAFLHAVLLRFPGINFVGHTHPIYTNMILSSKKAQEAMSGRLCPDHIVSMAHKSCYVPYVDPGLVMAREVKRRVEDFAQAEGMLPRAIVLENHGLFALGDCPKAVTSITDMTEKMSQIIVGTYALGGPSFMPEESVNRIFTRPDEAYRLKIIAK
ncbi:MAG TPA: class II aldolase/adducin family protein [Candidatus Hydrogenedentes bacterium]|nr:class II aldolase/adducin family protein [Candidatus Hydrogenedentota bacterium]HPG65435.1 class II aldolase/adducin family protein [Candidatus Hydrogenedentota bacterium]